MARRTATSWEGSSITMTSPRLSAVDSTIVDKYVTYVLPSATHAASVCAPKTRYECETWRRATERVYEAVQQKVGSHHARSSGATVRSTVSSSQSIPSCARLQRLPESTKKAQRGGRQPHGPTAQVDASGSAARAASSGSADPAPDPGDGRSSAHDLLPSSAVARSDHADMYVLLYSMPFSPE